MFFSLSDWTIKPHIKESLQNGGFLDAEKIILASELELRNCGSLSNKCIHEAREKACDIILGPSPFKIAFDILQSSKTHQWQKLSTGSKNLDKLLKGGIPRRGITELAGAAGVGKTQLSLQITAKTVCNGQGVIYISTEGPFPSRRLLDFLPKSQNAEKVFLSHCGDTLALMNALKGAEQYIHSKRVQFLILDSIAAIFRCDYDPIDTVLRAKAIQMLGHRLHKFTNYGCAVLCINQITEGPENIEPIPCLGLAWSNLVTTRLMATRNHSGLRFLRVLFSPEVGSHSCIFEITANGVVAQGDEDE